MILSEEIGKITVTINSEEKTIEFHNNRYWEDGKDYKIRFDDVDNFESFLKFFEVFRQIRKLREGANGGI